MPGGAPAGSLLGGVIFIVKFNGAILRPTIPRPLTLKPSEHHHEKYMDDASTALRVELKKNLISDPVNREKPLAYSDRSQQILPKDRNMLQYFIDDIEAFSLANKMKINESKTKVMKFCRAKKSDFPLEVAFSNGPNLEVITDFKLLGVVIQDDLKWRKNSEYICKRAISKFWLFRNMKKVGWIREN